MSPSLWLSHSESMTNALPFLPSKITPLRRSNHWIPRVRLLERLAQGKPLNLITAPAGYGKSVLLGQYIDDAQAKHKAVAYYRLEHEDNEQGEFCRYLIHAFNLAGLLTNSPLREAVQCSQLLALDAVLRQLLCDGGNSSHAIVVVLDDYHCINNSDIHQQLAFALKNTPPNIEWILSSREVPPIALERWRIEQKLEHLDSRDLAFSTAECDAFFQQHAIRLSGQHLQLAQSATQGWATGLQLLSLTDPTRFLGHQIDRTTALCEQGIGQFIDEEVFYHLSVAMQSFLMACAISQPIHPDLAQCLSGDNNAPQLLEQAYQQRLFIDRLDSEKQFFQFHPLFRAHLLTLLDVRFPGQKARLHRFALEWWEKRGYADLAMQHANESQDPYQLQRLLLRHGWELHFQGRNQLILSAMQTLGEDTIILSPQLTVLMAICAQVTRHQMHVKDRLLQLASERWPHQLPKEEWEKARHALASFDMDHQLWQGNYCKAMQLAQNIMRCDVVYEKGMESKVLNVTAQVNLHQGNLSTAQRHIDKAIQIAHDETLFQAQAYFYHIRALIDVAEGKLQDALIYQNKATELCQSLYLGKMVCYDFLLRYRAEIFLEKLFFRSAMACCYEAYDVLSNTEPRWRLPIQAQHLKITSLHGDWGSAQSLYQQLNQDIRAGSNPETNTELLIAKMVYALTLEDNRLIEKHLKQAQQLLSSISSRWLQCRLNLLVGLSLYRLNEINTAVEVLTETLNTARNDGYQREASVASLWLMAMTYQESGPDLAKLDALLQQVEQCDYLACCLLAKKELPPLLSIASKNAPKSALIQPVLKRLLALFKFRFADIDDASYPEKAQVVPLTLKEWEVLTGIGEGLTNEEIAEKHFVAPATIKSQIRSIYNKLEITSRSQAKVRYAELDAK